MMRLSILFGVAPNYILDLIGPSVTALVDQVVAARSATELAGL